MRLSTLPLARAGMAAENAPARIFEDPHSRALLTHLSRVAPSDASVLILGATGTGKEQVARHLHHLSLRRQAPFLAVNCGAFAQSLIDAELFDHEKGAFTGALGAQAGWFEEANGGTLFLDEIGDLPLHAQVKLLRVLQEREVVRLGSRRAIPVDVRVLAATNIDLEQAILRGEFREDLYYRLNVVSLRLRPLCERPGDILPLAHHFMAQYRHRLNVSAMALSDEACQRLVNYHWPGNIRQLENAIYHALLLCPGLRILPEHLNLISAGSRQNVHERDSGNLSLSGDELLQKALEKLLEEQDGALHEHVEAALLRMAYRYCHYNQMRTANLLGLSRNITRAHLIRLGELVVNRHRERNQSADKG